MERHRKISRYGNRSSIRFSFLVGFSTGRDNPFSITAVSVDKIATDPSTYSSFFYPISFCETIVIKSFRFEKKIFVVTRNGSRTTFVSKQHGFLQKTYRLQKRIVEFCFFETNNKQAKKFSSMIYQNCIKFVRASGTCDSHLYSAFISPLIIFFENHFFPSQVFPGSNVCGSTPLFTCIVAKKSLTSRNF